MQKGTFNFLKAPSLSRKSSYDNYIVTLFNLFFIQSVTFPDETGYPMSHYTVTDLLTYRDSDSTVLPVVAKDVHH